MGKLGKSKELSKFIGWIKKGPLSFYLSQLRNRLIFKSTLNVVE